MKNSFKSLVVALGAVLITLPALQADDLPAGGPPDGRRAERREKMGEKMGDRMAEELGLSADQKAQMQQLKQQEKAEMETLRDGTGMTEDKRAKVEAIRKSYLEKRQAIMTPEQREKAKLMREKGGKRMEERRGERRDKSGEPK